MAVRASAAHCGYPELQIARSGGKPMSKIIDI
jgi:hypothetical protein